MKVIFCLAFHFLTMMTIYLARLLLNKLDKEHVFERRNQYFHCFL